MIYTKKQAKKLGLNPVIDLRKMYAEEYIESTKTEGEKKKEIILLFTVISWIIWFIIFTLWMWSWFMQIWKAEAKWNLTIAEKIRLERLESCKKYAHIEKIYWQDADVRCATFMTLVFAYESNFGKSKMCKNNKNCYWMKGNWVDTPSGFIKFKTYKEADDWFAKMYFKFHYKKKINTFVNNWSMTDRLNYKYFLNKNYFKIYNEILQIKK